MSDWDALEQNTRLELVRVGAAIFRTGQRVRLRPRGGGDIFDLALAGKTATIEAIEQDLEDRIYIVVTVDDDPGKEFGELRQPGHRFFFPAHWDPKLRIPRGQVVAAASIVSPKY